MQTGISVNVIGQNIKVFGHNMLIEGLTPISGRLCGRLARVGSERRVSCGASETVMSVAAASKRLEGRSIVE